MSYAMYVPLRAVIAKFVAFETASGGTTSVRPAAGIAIVPPSGPIVCDTVMSEASGVVLSSGTIVLVDVAPVLSRPPRSVCDVAVGGAMDFGAAGGSFEHAEAANVAMAATAKVVKRRRRIVAILWSVAGGRCCLAGPSRASHVPWTQLVQRAGIRDFTYVRTTAKRQLS